MTTTISCCCQTHRETWWAKNEVGGVERVVWTNISKISYGAIATLSKWKSLTFSSEFHHVGRWVSTVSTFNTTLK